MEDMGAASGLALWMIFLTGSLLFHYFCILLLLIAPLRIFFILRRALRQKGFYPARAALMLLSIILLLCVAQALSRAWIYALGAQTIDPYIMVFHLLAQPAVCGLWLLLEGVFFCFPRPGKTARKPALSTHKIPQR